MCSTCGCGGSDMGAEGMSIIKGLTSTEGMMGGVMFLLGIHQFGWLKENIGEFVIMDAPFVGEITPLKILGVGGIYYGGKMLYECCL